MKPTCFVPSVLRGLPLAACLSLTSALALGQEAVKNDPATAVPLDARKKASAGVEGLRAAWAKFSKDGPGVSKAGTVVKKPKLGMSAANSEEGLSAPRRLSLVLKAKEEYTNPKELRSVNGELKVELQVDYANKKIGSDNVHLRMYNGELVGPTLRVKPGDRIRLTLKNMLPGERWQPNMMNTLNTFNAMNMHYHGLHVSPNGISDNVLIQVGPHETQEYILDIPKDHTTGTYWYHPHRHGSTAGDVASSLSGTLIIEGGLDDIPEIKKAKERVMVLNQIPYVYQGSTVDANGNIQPPPPGTPLVGVVEEEYASAIFGPGQWAPLGRYTTINGIQIPVIHMQPGQVERWRFVDSGQRETILLGMAAAASVEAYNADPTKKISWVKLHEIAVDGLALGKIVAKDQIELWPGYRSDVLVKAPTAKGEYILVDGDEPASVAISGQKKDLNYVARIIVDGPSDSMALPTNAQVAGLRLPSIKDSEITGQQTAAYGILAVGSGVVFTIDHKSFDMETARELQLGNVDEWTISTNNTVANGFVTHPFHIHVNPFEVTSIMTPKLDANGKPLPPDKDGKYVLVEDLKNGPEWRDTVKIPGNGYVKMRTHYTDFIGTFVQHCHILDHEDQGMMQLIDIVDKKGANAAYLPVPPANGTVAPAISLPDSQGKLHTLAEVKGKPTVLFFFKGYGCLHCVQQVTAFTDHYKEFQAKGIEVIGVTSDDVATLKAGLEGNACPFTLLADPKGKAFAAYGCQVPGGLLHGTFTLDADQKITWGTVSASPYVDVTALLKPSAAQASVNDEAAAAKSKTVAAKK